jgi:hypothetical protein
MDTLESYRELCERILADYTRIPYAYGDINIQTVFDRASDHYMVMLVGREGKKRVHGCLIHLDLVDGKIWIQRDGTEHGVARDLLEAGVPKDRIVLAFRSPEVRQESGLAVA